MKTLGQELRDAINGEERQRIFQKFLKTIRAKVYKQTPLKPLRKNKPRKGEVYCERTETTRASYKVICYECHKIYVWPDYFVLKRSGVVRMCKCGSDDVRWIGPIARLPKKNASKKKWDEFWKHCGKSCAGACR